MNATLEENTTNATATDKTGTPSKYIAYNREGVALGEIWAADYDEAFNAAAQQYDAMVSVRIEGEPAPAPAEAEPAGAVKTAEPAAEEEIPKVGKGGPLAWFKRMAMLHGDHPRVLASSKEVLKKAGIDPADITEAVLKEATKLCLPAAKTWAERQKKAGQVVDINDQAWFNVGQPKANQTGSIATEANRLTESKSSRANTGGSKGEYGVTRLKDLPWNRKKVLVFKALKSLKAVSSDTAVSTKSAAEKCGLSPRDVRHYSYHAKAAGLVEVVKSEDGTGYKIFITEAGRKIDLDKVL